MLFVIGNGFDIALGLETSYIDFVNWYIMQTEKLEDPRIRRFKNKIQSDIEININSWADLEIKLGEYTAQYGENEVDDFLFVYWDMKGKLNEYIKNQESLVNLSDKDIIAKELTQFFLSFYKQFPTNTKNLLTKILEGNQNVQYHFVTFNYTRTLENCINLFPTPLRIRDGLHLQHRDTIESILHLHGEIDNAPLVGVDSASQIHNDAFRSDIRILRALVKPLMNEQMQENVETKALELINRSKIICIFGTSLGDSDVSWWKNIGEWLKKSAERRLVIFWYSKEPLSPLYPDIRLTREDSVRKSFMKQAGFTEADSAKVENRIISHIHSNIFNMKLISDTTSEIKKITDE